MENQKSSAPFTPFIHHCKDGNHYHVVTGNKYGASPAFVSRSNFERILGVIVDPQNNADVSDAARLHSELDSLTYRAENKRKRPLTARDQSWELVAGAHWPSLINGTLRASEMSAFIFYSKTSCDFIRITHATTKLTLQALTVEESQIPLCR